MTNLEDFMVVIGWITIMFFSLGMGASNLILLKLVLSHRVFVRSVQAELYRRLDRIDAKLGMMGTEKRRLGP